MSKELESSNHQTGLRVVYQLFLATASTSYQLTGKETERGCYGTLWHSLAIADGKLTSSLYQLNLILILGCSGCCIGERCGYSVCWLLPAIYKKRECNISWCLVS